jgi:hypothetical protein
VTTAIAMLMLVAACQQGPSGPGDGDGDGDSRLALYLDHFVEEGVQLNLEGASSFGLLLQLSNGAYMINSNTLSLVRVVADGEVLTDEASIPIEGIDAFVMSSFAYSIYPGDGIVTLLGRSGESIVFVRHDGQTQVNLPVPDELSIQRVSVARSGAIEFIARDLINSEFVRGRFAAGSTGLVVTPSDLLRPEDVVAFTALN